MKQYREEQFLEDSLCFLECRSFVIFILILLYDSSENKVKAFETYLIQIFAYFVAQHMNMT